MICPQCKSNYFGPIYTKGTCSSCGYSVSSPEEYLKDLNSSIFSEINENLQERYVGIPVTRMMKEEISLVIESILRSYDLGNKGYKTFVDYFEPTRELDIIFTDKDENQIYMFSPTDKDIVSDYVGTLQSDDEIREDIIEIVENRMKKSIREYNDKITREKVRSSIENDLKSLDKGNFTVICDETNNPSSVIDKNALGVKIFSKDLDLEFDFLLEPKAGEIVIDYLGKNHD